MILAVILSWLPATIAFIAVLAVLVLVHEWGHFMAARRVGMEVLEFGFGFPPRVYGKKIKGTLYSLNLIPLGGFVRIKGEDGKDKGEGTFGSKPVLARIFVVCAGVLMNFVLAYAAIVLAFYLKMPPLVSHPEVYSGKLQEGTVGLVVNQVQSGSLAEKHEIIVGDVIVKAEDRPVSFVGEIKDTISGNHGKTVSFEIYRAGERKNIEVAVEDQDILGVGLAPQVPKVQYAWYLVPYYALIETGKVIGYTFVAIATFLKNLVVHQIVPAEVSGPVGIFQITAVAVQLGFAYVLNLIIILSVNLGILNILPFPALDGGRFVFLIAEKIRGRKVADKIENTIHSIGFIILLVLIVLVTYRDIIRL